MQKNDYQYQLRLWKDDGGDLLGVVPVTADFVPAEQAVLFQGVRRGEFAEITGALTTEITPIWESRRGEPHVSGFRASVGLNGGNPASGEFSISYFSGLAGAAASGFVKTGQLKSGDLYRYAVEARPLDQASTRRPRIQVQSGEAPWPIRDGSLPELLRASVCFGDGVEADSPVFIDFSVLQTASALTRLAGSQETAGVLVGHLCRDASAKEAFIHVKALIPVRAETAELTKFTFTGEMWSGVRRAIAARGREELMLGWFHCHSFYYETCGTGGAEERVACGARRPGLSEEDCHLHRVVFPRAYGVALLVNDAPCTGLSWHMYGWRLGAIAARAYHVVGMPMPRQVSPQNQNQGVCHAT